MFIYECQNITLHCGFPLHFTEYLNFESDQSVDIYLDVIPPLEDSNAIFYQIEPNSLSNIYNKINSDNRWKNIKHIFVYDPTQITNRPSVHSTLCGTTWIRKLDYEKIYTKQFKVTSLIGHKNSLPGHKLRLELFQNKDKLKIPSFIFESGKTLNKSQYSKFEMFKDSMFHIVFENCTDTSCFTEKLIDCLITKTIPCYYGPNDIDKYFNTTGWIIFNETDTIDSFIDKINRLTPEHYHQHKNIIEQNYQTAKNYVNWYNIIFSGLNGNTNIKYKKCEKYINFNIHEIY